MLRVAFIRRDGKMSFVGDEIYAINAGHAAVVGYSTYPKLSQGTRRTEEENAKVVKFIRDLGHDAGYVMAPLR
jgi:hypothetical protein